jgi:hypothetical protein
LVAAHQSDLLPKIAEEVDAEFLLRRGGRNPIDAEAGEKTDNSKSQKEVAGIDFASMKVLRQRRAGYRADDDREKSA